MLLESPQDIRCANTFLALGCAASRRNRLGEHGRHTHSLRLLRAVKSVNQCAQFSSGEAKTLSDGVRLESAKIDNQQEQFQVVRRVVVTGLGFISSIGNNKKTVLDSLLNQRTGIELHPELDLPISPVRLAGTIK